MLESSIIRLGDSEQRGWKKTKAKELGSNKSVIYFGANYYKKVLEKSDLFQVVFYYLDSTRINCMIESVQQRRQSNNKKL